MIYSLKENSKTIFPPMISPLISNMYIDIYRQDSRSVKDENKPITSVITLTQTLTCEAELKRSK